MSPGRHLHGTEPLQASYLGCTCASVLTFATSVSWVQPSPFMSVSLGATSLSPGHWDKKPLASTHGRRVSLQWTATPCRCRTGAWRCAWTSSTTSRRASRPAASPLRSSRTCASKARAPGPAKSPILRLAVILEAKREGVLHSHWN